MVVTGGNANRMKDMLKEQKAAAERRKKEKKKERMQQMVRSEETSPLDLSNRKRAFSDEEDDDSAQVYTSKFLNEVSAPIYILDPIFSLLLYFSFNYHHRYS